MKIVPQLLYQHPNVKKILVDGLSAIVYKNIDTIDTQTDHYVATHVLSVVLKGRLRLQTYYEGEQFEALPHQAVFIPKGRYMISDIIPEHDSFEAVFFFFEERLIDQFLAALSILPKAIPTPYHFVIPYTDTLQQYTNAILQVYAPPSQEYKAVTTLKLMELLHLLYASPYQQQFINVLQSLQHKKKRHLKDFMLDNFDKPLHIEDYAFLTGRSLATFRRDFKRQFERAPKSWLTEKRLEKAIDLLQHSSQTVQQIALAVGYENVGHFSTVFKKKYHIAPKQFRIQQRIDQQL